MEKNKSEEGERKKVFSAELSHLLSVRNYGDKQGRRDRTTGSNVRLRRKGAVMAANVLNSRQAVRMSVFVVRAFVQMRELLSAGSKELAIELKQLEAKLTSRLDLHESALVDVLRRIMELLNPRPLHPNRKNPWASTAC